MRLNVIRGAVAVAALASSLSVAAEQRPATIESTVDLVAKVCRLYVDKDNRDVRKLEQRLGATGATFSEITQMRLMCELYARGRDDATRPTEMPNSPPRN